MSHIQFKFDLNWLDNPDFYVQVEKIWLKPCRAKSALDKIQQKLKLFKQFFKGWGFNLQGELTKKRKELQLELSSLEELEETSYLTEAQVLRKHWVLCENLKLLEQEELYWLQRSHETQLLKGDENTKYFHECANGRKRKNTIIFLEKDGEIIEGDDNLLKHASEYYVDLFGLVPQHDIHLDASIWNNCYKLSETDNRKLCLPFSKTEIKEALF